MSQLVQSIGKIAPHLTAEEITDLAEVNGRAILRNHNYHPLAVYVELKRYQHYLDALVRCMTPAATEQAHEVGARFPLNGAEIILEERFAQPTLRIEL